MSGGGQGSSGFPSSYSGQSNFGSSYSPPSYGGYGGSPNYFPQYQPQNSGYPNRFAAFGGQGGSSGNGAMMDMGMPSSFPSYSGSYGAPSNGGFDKSMGGQYANFGGNGMGGMSDIMSAPDSGMPAPQAPQAPQSSQGMYQPQGNGAPAGYTYDQQGALISNSLAAQAGVQPNYGPGTPQQPTPQQDPQAQAKGITLSEGPKLGNFGSNTGQSWLYGPTAGMFGAARPQGTPNNYWYNQNVGQWGPLTPQVR
jgi:hypothetical protein